MHIPRPPGDHGNPGPGPGWGGGSADHDSPVHFGFIRGFLHNLCTAISSCFYFLCCCWVLEYWFGGRSRSLNPGGSPLLPSESVSGAGPSSQPSWHPGPPSMPFEQPGPLTFEQPGPLGKPTSLPGLPPV